ncbi:xylitol dehydrogenase [Cymbomonas tetramitiformis]|uniref:Xylitol dehydrogenase n=1 Tax=Cymbomonas tetramitiformis TaxID=36881 RepID=A0AAE0GUM0_9CHLO|nr:xylitol dehydrogenase [Cymbomonas tetramitiformis]
MYPSPLSQEVLREGKPLAAGPWTPCFQDHPIIVLRCIGRAGWEVSGGPLETFHVQLLALSCVLSLQPRAVAPTASRGPNRGLQYTEIKEGAVEGGAGTSLMHCSADLQVTGEAQYTDDIKMASDGLHAALVFSEKPHAKLLSVDAAEALAMEGVAGFFSAKDVPGGNDIGPVLHDEQVFATDTVTCVGQVIGVVVAETEQQARSAALAVKVTYEELPAIMSIEEAIEAESFYSHPMAVHKLECGNVDACFASPEAAHVLEGDMRVGGQEHFYLEPNCCVVTPVEGDEITMVASTQCPMKHQKSVAHALGLPMNKVQCKTKRIGGGFGGKETRSVFLCCAAAVPAYLLQRSVRLCLDRDEDMMSTGQRHAFVAKYKVACTAEGKLLGLHSDFYNNAGNSLDLSHSIMDRCLFHCDNSYKWPNLRAVGHCCYTNQSSNTAFRGFGGPQGMMLTEMIIERVATAVGKTPEAVRQLNLYKVALRLEFLPVLNHLARADATLNPRMREVTHYGQTLELCRTPAVWSQVMETSGFAERRAAVDVFNRSSRWRKRGLAVTPTKFGISFTTTFLNQAGSLVHIYTDGTVLVTHGGVEMGQGLHTKMAQVAATSLGIPISAVFISETNTDKVPNASPTAASASSDMYGGAILDACTQLNERLAPLRLANPTASFKEVVNSAYMQRIDLSAHGFYRTPDIYFDWDTGSGRPFNYLCYGAACTEVEVDCLTAVLDIKNTYEHAMLCRRVSGKTSRTVSAPA